MALRLLILILLIGALFGGIFSLKWQQMQQQAAGPSGPPPAVVATVQVMEQNWQPRLNAVGSLVASQGIYVTNEVAGLVREILFESGQTINQGGQLIQLDDNVDRADLQGLFAQRNLAQIKLDRFARLIRDRSASQSEFDEAKAELDGAQASVKSKEALLDKKRITAPFTGRLGIRLVDLGEFLPTGTRIALLNNLDPIFVDYALAERHLPKLEINRTILVKVAAYPDQTFSGTISAINPGVDAATRTIRIRATLDNAEQLLRPGMFAEVETLLPSRKDLLTLPRTAISYAPYGDTVFLVQDNDGALQVQRRQVTTGQASDGYIEIVQGLESGDQVVSVGQNKLFNGQTVMIDNSIAPPESGPMDP